MHSQKTELSVNLDVLEKMVEIAANEVEGVAGLSRRVVNLKVSKNNILPFTGVKVEMNNGAVEIQVYICVEQNAPVRKVAAAVQENVKDKIQTMTGTAVTKVNVIVADLAQRDIKLEKQG